jgi:outer membrane protein assembly factor BamB
MTPTTITWGVALALAASQAAAQDWPQWRGPNRDAKTAGFAAPKTWPKELALKWKVTVGEGVATPALVDDKLYVFSRENGNEVTRCLDAASGKELWVDQYESPGASGSARGFSGPRSSPTVADGKVVTLGVRGMLSCLDAATGKKLWRKDAFQAYPMFHPASSPLAANGLCIAQLGGQDNGALVAYDLISGEQKWKWAGDTPGYASPVLMTVGGAQFVIAETSHRIVAVRAADGKLAWETPYAGGWNTSTPIVERDTLFFSGPERGTRAIRLEPTAAGFTGKELWKNAEKSVQFNTPVMKDGLLYGFTGRNEFFCLNAQDGKTAWSAPTGGGGDYGSIVDAGPVLLALTPRAELIAFQPGDRAYAELARIKVADSETYAYPVISGNRIFIKDRESVRLWTIQ